jgi:hypothetical protein
MLKKISFASKIEKNSTKSSPELNDFNWDVREGDFKSITELSEDLDFHKVKNRKKKLLLVITIIFAALLTYIVVHLMGNI